MKIIQILNSLNWSASSAYCINASYELIKVGNSIVKNPVLASFAYHILPYRGIGSSIMIALKEYPDIEFVNDLNNIALNV